MKSNWLLIQWLWSLFNTYMPTLLRSTVVPCYFHWGITIRMHQSIQNTPPHPNLAKLHFRGNKAKMSQFPCNCIFDCTNNWTSGDDSLLVQSDIQLQRKCDIFSFFSSKMKLLFILYLTFHFVYFDICSMSYLRMWSHSVVKQKDIAMFEYQYS